MNVWLHEVAHTGKLIVARNYRLHGLLCASDHDGETHTCQSLATSAGRTSSLHGHVTVGSAHGCDCLPLQCKSVSSTA